MLLRTVWFWSAAAQSGKALKSDFIAADLRSSWLILDVFGAFKSIKYETEM